MFTRFNKKIGKSEIIRTFNTPDEEAQRFMARCAKIADDIGADLCKLAD